MLRLLTATALSLLLATSSCGGGDDCDGELYDSFGGAGGPSCTSPDDAESTRCFAGDRCVEPGVCMRVRSDADTGCPEGTYDSFGGADGPRCTGPDDVESTGCFPGDRCVEPGVCQ